MYRLVAYVGITLAVFLANAAGYAPAIAKSTSFEVLKGFDLPSSDYRSGFTESRLKGISKKACRKECAKDNRCRAFTFNVKARVCFLKESVPQRVPFAGAVSGIKVEGDRTARAGRHDFDEDDMDLEEDDSDHAEVTPPRQATPPTQPPPQIRPASPSPAPSGTSVPTPRQTPPVAQASPSPRRVDSIVETSGLRYARGLPVIAGTRRSVLSDEQVAAASAFLGSVELGLDPGLIDSNPACWARMLLPKSESDRYLSSGADASRAQKHFVIGREVLAWKGADEFEAERSKQAFLADHAGALKAKAVALPFKAIVVDELTLPAYDTQAGGFDLRLNSLNRQNVALQNLGAYLGVTYGRPICTNTDFAFSPAAVKLPEIWSIDATRAADAIKRLDQRKVYLAIVLEFRAMPLAKMEDKNRPSNRVPVWSEIVSVALYEDVELQRQIAVLPVSNAAEPVLLSDIPEGAQFPDAVSIDDETMALLLLRDHGDVLAPEAWRLLMLHQADVDRDYYSRQRKIDTGWAVRTVEDKDYDSSRVPFFPNGFSASFQTQFTEAQIAKFKKWAMARAQHLPDELILPAKISRQENSPPQLILPVVNEKDRTGLVAALAGQGYAVGQILQPDVDPTGSGRRFNQAYIAGPHKSRVPALILPNLAASYIPELTDAAAQQIFEGEPGYRRVDILIETGPSELVPMNEASEVFALKGKPTRLRSFGKDGADVVFEQQYDVSTLDPSRLEIEAPVVTTPNVEALALTAEAMDLLMVKLAPDSVSDETYRQMMLARWAYEASNQEEPIWGRFFVPGKPRPTEEQQAKLLPGFKEWTVKRAAALPKKLRLHYDGATVKDGEPVSVTLPGSFESRDPNLFRSEMSACRRDISVYPALAPACEYLERVFKDTPKIHPFGLGDTLSGPRLWCRAATGFGSREVYCEARKEQFDKVRGSQVEPGFRDVLVLDQEIFIPANQSKVPVGMGVGMDVDIDVSGVRIAELPLLVAPAAAMKKYREFREGLGIGGSTRIAEDQTQAAKFLIFDAKVMSARLVKNGSDEAIMDLELRHARAPDLEALKLPETAAAAPSAAFGPDIVGLRLGMTFAEADKIIRSHMKVGRVLIRDRARQPASATGGFEKYSSSKLYAAEGNSEFIVLYDEPPATKHIVVGITRQVNFPKGQMTSSAALDQLRNKYGPEIWIGKQGHVGWGDGLAETTFADLYMHNCLASSQNRLPTDWLQEDGTPTDWTATSSKSGINNGVPNMAMYGDPAGRNCGPDLAMEYSSVNDPAQEDRLILHLTDPNRYNQLYEESKKLIQTGKASFAPKTAAPDIKL